MTCFDIVAPYCVLSMEIFDLRRTLFEKKVREIVLHGAESIEPGTATLSYFFRDGVARTPTPEVGAPARRMGTETTVLECDSVILVTARAQNNELFKALKARKSEWADNDVQAVYQVGDCHAPRLIADCVFDGHRLAREFESDDPQYPLPWIRERQVWGHETFPKLAG